MDQDLFLERGLQIVTKLTDHGYDAYLIGGVVRDCLLHQPFTDIDICTSAKPNEILEIFPYAIDDYQAYGCITLKEGEMLYEITTFREENYDNQHRKPSNIIYTNQLEIDVKRRDFTINALAYSKNRTLIDLVGGEDDLKQKLIRLIGNTRMRFKEDPLRMLRGLNLVSRYNFHFHPATMQALGQNAYLLKTVSTYQFTAELSDILQGRYVKEALKIIKWLNLFSYDKALRKWVKKLLRHNQKLTLLEKMTLLYAIKGQVDANTCFTKANIAEMEKMIVNIQYLMNNQVTPLDVYDKGEKELLDADRLAKILKFSYRAKSKAIRNIAKALPIHSRGDIKYQASDILNHTNGQSGKFIGQILEKIEERIVEGKLENDYQAIDKAVEVIIPLYYKPHYYESDLKQEDDTI